MSLASRSVRGAVFLSASAILNIVVGFFGGILLARLLPPNDFGTFVLAVTVSAFVDLRTKLQFDQKYLRDPDPGGEQLDALYTLSTGLAALSLLLLGLTALGALWFHRPDLTLCLIVLGLLNLLDPLGMAIRLSIEKQVAFRAVSFIQTAAGLTQFVTTFIGAVAGFGLWSLLIGQAASVLLNLLLFLRIAPRRPALRLNGRLAREFLAYGLKYGVVYSASATVLTQFDNLAVGLLNGTFALGFYDRAYRTSLWPTTLISAALGRISLPTYSQFQDDPARLSKAFSLVLWTVLTLTTPIALTLLVTAPDLVPVLYGAKWLPAVPILQVLAAFAVFRPLWDDLVSILIATRRPGQMARLVFWQALILILLVIPLTWLYSAVGTAISVGVAFLISTIFLFHFARVHLHVNLVEAVGLPLLNNLVALALYAGFRWLLPLEGLSTWLRLGVEGGLWLGGYAAISLVTSRRTILSRVRYLLQVVRG